MSLDELIKTSETQLLQRIDRGIPADLLAQDRILRQKREAETLTDSEHDRLIQLSTQIEQIGAQRLEALAHLAQLRQVSLLDLMETIGIQPVSYV
jgi:hypothetical protein